MAKSDGQWDDFPVVKNELIRGILYRGIHQVGALCIRVLNVGPTPFHLRSYYPLSDLWSFMLMDFRVLDIQLGYCTRLNAESWRLMQHSAD